MYNPNVSTLVNDGKHIASILERTKCNKHNAPEGIPCHHVPKGSSVFGFYAAICGGRIKRAGYNGKISPTSLQLKTPTGRRPINGTTRNNFKKKD